MSDVLPVTSMPIVLDGFSGAGGATKGYQRAGFSVVGIDIKPQPNYCGDMFIQGDVIELLPKLNLRNVVLAHLSPPCQRDAAITKGTNKHRRELHKDWYTPTKELLDELEIPYVIENPASRPDVVLCGEMFGLGVLRHRKFEANWPIEQPPHRKHRGRVRGWRHGKHYDGPYVAVYGKGGGKATLAEAGEAMGIDWMTELDEIVEAIPPAYTEWIGKQLMAHLEMANAA